MVGNVINALSAYATVQASASVANGVVSLGTASSILTAIGVEEDFPNIDFKLTVVGTPVVNSEIHIVRRAGDGVTQEPIPVAAYKPNVVGGFILNSSVNGDYYTFGIRNVDKNSEYYLYNKDAGTLTLALSARASGYNVD